MYKYLKKYTHWLARERPLLWQLCNMDWILFGKGKGEDMGWDDGEPDQDRCRWSGTYSVVWGVGCGEVGLKKGQTMCLTD